MPTSPTTTLFLWWTALLQCVGRVVGRLQFLYRRWTAPTVTLDTGRRVRMGRQVAEGGFSYVFEAYSDDDDNPGSARRGSSSSMERYALKRIRCPDPELLEACRKEAAVHRQLPPHYPYLLQLLGMTIVHPNQADCSCYMLFPYLDHSLRTEVNQRTRIGAESSSRASQQHAPWNELIALQLFYKICSAVSVLHHQAHLSHRDIKVENVLFTANQRGGRLGQPVLMDFGSAGPLTESIATRRQVSNMVEQASIHTTMSYRPPELFEGGVRAGDKPDLDFTKVDVWALGCTLFAMLYGASPAESEFRKSSSSHGGGGHLQIVDCTQLKVLSGLPPRPIAQTTVAGWYSSPVHDLMAYMLTQDRQARPTLDQVLERVEQVIVQQHGGRVDKRFTGTQYRDDEFAHVGSHDSEDETSSAGIALMTSAV